jgi:hypothetical protein
VQLACGWHAAGARGVQPAIDRRAAASGRRVAGARPTCSGREDGKWPACGRRAAGVWCVDGQLLPRFAWHEGRDDAAPLGRGHVAGAPIAARCQGGARQRRAITARGRGGLPVAPVAAVSSRRDLQRCFYRTIPADGSARLLCRNSFRCFDAAGRIA